jgi:hypothetical protein
MAMVRDTAVQKLRDLTIAVAVAAAAAVALIAWISAATIPGASAQTTAPATVDGGGQPVAGNDDGFNQGQPVTSRPGPGIVVSGGSH